MANVKTGGIMAEVIPLERIERRIYLIRGQKVMLDRDLAELYRVKTGQLTRQVRRNLKRFPPDFMIRLIFKEFSDLKCQIGISNWGGTRVLPYAFTENGVAMLSTVLNSERAMQVNIQIMRTFTRLREVQESQKQVLNQLNKHEVRLLQHDRQFTEVFHALDDMRKVPEPIKRKKIGFTPDE
jgi:hypothetical protein